MRSKPVILVALLLAAFLINLDTILVNVALPALVRELHATTTATLPASVPVPVAAIAHQSVGAAYLTAGKIAALGHPALGQALQHASANAFLRGLTVGAAGALLAVLFLPAQPIQPIQPARPASPAADEPATAEGRHVAGTPAHPASAAR
jgi:MFS family permease